MNMQRIILIEILARLTSDTNRKLLNLYPLKYSICSIDSMSIMSIKIKLNQAKIRL